MLSTVVLLSMFTRVPAFACTLLDTSNCPYFMNLISDAIGRDDTSLSITSPVIRINLGDRASFPVSIPRDQNNNPVTVFIVSGVTRPGEQVALSLSYYNLWPSQLSNLQPSLFYSDNILFVIDMWNISTDFEWMDDSTRRSTYHFIIDVIRNTNYMEILRDERGEFLDAVRTVGANRNLLRALDSAQSMGEIENIMARSVVFSPGRLLRPVKLLSQFYNIENSMNSFGGACFTGGIVGGNLHAGLLSARADKNFGATNIGIFARASQMQYRGTLDNFNATVFGGGAHAKFDKDRFYVSARAGIDYTGFQTEFIFCPKNFATYNPTGIAGHVSANIGWRIINTGSFEFMPMMRAHGFYGEVLHDSYSALSISTGARVNYHVQSTPNMTKEYGAYILSGNNYTQFGIRIGVYVPRDNMNLWGSVSRIDNAFGTFNKIGLGLRYIF